MTLSAEAGPDRRLRQDLRERLRRHRHRGWGGIGARKLSIAGIDMVINPDSDAYEVEISEIKATYMHMLGHDCHPIVANLQGYLDKGHEIFLSVHYGLEIRRDAETKIAYFQDLKAIVAKSFSTEDSTAEVNSRYPGYYGASYSDMTIWFFFP